MTSHLRVVGLDDDVAALQQLLDNKGAGSVLQEHAAWRQLQFEALYPQG
jgi:hypothetical protein